MSEAEEKRTKRVNPRLTPSEYAKLHTIGKSYNKSASEILRISAFGGLETLERSRPMKGNDSDMMTDEQYAQLHGDVQKTIRYLNELSKISTHINNNINQVAKVANTSKRVDGSDVEELAELTGDWKKVVMNINKNYKKDVMKFWSH